MFPGRHVSALGEAQHWPRRETLDARRGFLAFTCRARTASGHLVDPADVAGLAVYLMTDDARSVTGSVFSIDAGRTAT